MGDRKSCELCQTAPNRGVGVPLSWRLIVHARRPRERACFASRGSGVRVHHHIRLRSRQLQVRWRQATQPDRRQWSALPVPAERHPSPYPRPRSAEKAALTQKFGRRETASVGLVLRGLFDAGPMARPHPVGKPSRVDADCKRPGSWPLGASQQGRSELAASYDGTEPDRIKITVKVLALYGYLLQVGTYGYTSLLSLNGDNLLLALGGYIRNLTPYGYIVASDSSSGRSDESPLHG